MKNLAAFLLLAPSICFAANAQEGASSAPAQIRVTVSGDVNKRGHYQLGEGATLSEALAAAGGLGVYAPNKIQLIRGDKISIIDMKKLLKEGSKGPVLKDGDNIQAPIMCW